MAEDQQVFKKKYVSKKKAQQDGGREEAKQTPLAHSFTFWVKDGYVNHPTQPTMSADSYKNSIKEIASFETVRDSSNQSRQRSSGLYINT